MEAQEGGILIISGIGGDTRRYRCLHLQEQLALRGYASTLREPHDPRLPDDVLHHEMVILHRVPLTPMIDLVIALAHSQGKAVIFETDDLIFEPTLQAQIGYLDALPPEEARRFREALEGQQQSFRRSDAVLTATAFLAEEAQKRGKRAYVHRNVPSREMFRIAAEAREQRESHAPAVVLGYFSGTASHDRDFQSIVPALVWAMERYPNLWLHIGGYLEPDERFHPFQQRIRRVHFVPWQELPHFIAQVDINLVPLEMDNPFCQAKSEIKFLEAALVEVPTIATPIRAYRHAIRQGENGLLAGTEAEWREALQRLIEDEGARRRMGEAALRTVYAHYLPEQRAEALEALLPKLRAAAPPPQPPGQAAESLLAATARYAAQMETRDAVQRQQLAALRQTLRSYEKHLFYAEQQIRQLEAHIQAIMQGRVMRLMTQMHRWRQALFHRQPGDDSSGGQSL